MSQRRAGGDGGEGSALRAALEFGVPQSKAPFEALQPAGREIKAHRPAAAVTWALVGIGVDRLNAVQGRDVAAGRGAGNAQQGRLREQRDREGGILRGGGVVGVV